MLTSELRNVEITGGLWGKELDKNRTVTIPSCGRRNYETGRVDALKLERRDNTSCIPHHFWDSDIAKWLEAAAFSLQTDPDPQLEKEVDGIISLIKEGQGEDGYFNSHFMIACPEKRWHNLRDMHELYCAGHLMEAAVAYFEATGKKEFLEIMCRFADHIDSVFGNGPEQLKGYPGHEEIELALVKMYKATGVRKYLELASFFVDRRGEEPNYFVQESKLRKQAEKYAMDYHQAHKPVREQDEALGHAVRAVYLYSGMADLALINNDEKLASACRNLWSSIVNRKMYVTGGIGSCYAGEDFAADYDLPNEEAYAETCASIGLIFFAYRMFLLDRDSSYIDVLERALYNGASSGLSVDGERFFYVNPLACDPDGILANGKHIEPRPEWFVCSCCPPNVARLRASLGQYFYEYDDHNIWVNLYNDCRCTVTIDGVKVKLEQLTDYPWDGSIRITLGMDKSLDFKMRLRIPGWCNEYLLLVNGEEFCVKVRMEKGYAVIERTWNPGDQVELNLKMPIEKVYANPMVRHDCGRVAFQRGPVVYCIEEEDNGSELNAVEIDRNAEFYVSYEEGLLDGVATISGPARKLKSAPDCSLYSTALPEYSPCVIKAVPYFRWGNRNFGEMLVWLRYY